LPFRGSYKREHIMRKSLRQVLDRLRSATTGRWHKQTSIRGGLQQPQRFEAIPVRARVRF